MKLTFLGTGTSFGIPVIGCECEVCRSDDPRDQRTRHGLLLAADDRRLLFDTPPELRLQLVRARVRSLDAVVLSHEHADHTHGIDDLRVFTQRDGGPLPLYVAEEFEAELVRRFDYVWGDAAVAQPGSSIPRLEIHTFRTGEPIEPGGFALTPVRIGHGVYDSYAFRCGSLGIVIDGKRIPPEGEALLKGVHTLVINALWFGNPHPGHFSIEEAIEVAGRLGARRTYLTHLTHRVSQAELDRRLPQGIHGAYDGLTVDV